MDLQALERDVKQALSHLPAEVLQVLVHVAETVIVKHRDALEKALPIVKDLLMPHVGAVIMESSMGILNSKELEDTLMGVLNIKAAPVVEVKTDGAHGG